MIYHLGKALFRRTFLRDKLSFVYALVALGNGAVGKLYQLLLRIYLLFASQIELVICAVRRKE